jgi:hypothetical protein
MKSLFLCGGGVIILVILFLFSLGSREGFSTCSITSTNTAPSSTTGIYKDTACSTTGYNTIPYYTYYKKGKTRNGTTCGSSSSQTAPSSTEGIYKDNKCSTTGYNTTNSYNYYKPTTYTTK